MQRKTRYQDLFIFLTVFYFYFILQCNKYEQSSQFIIFLQCNKYEQSSRFYFIFIILLIFFIL